MASLREIKTKITSVKSTQQITSAMQMVSTVKLAKAQRVSERFRPYQEKISELLTNFLRSEETTPSVFEEVREANRVAIVVFASNMSLCGSFNANVIKEFTKLTLELSHLPKENIDVYSIGKQITHAVKKLGFTPQFESNDLANSPNYEDTAKIADELMEQFRTKKIDQVIVIYHHFRSKGSQILTRNTLLPLSLDKLKEEKDNAYIDYIVEPNKETILAQLIPQVIKLTLYAALLESHTSEHAARSIAMQGATDNADDLLEELSLVYNKSRQQSITNELLDIIGATFK
ncbi:MAG: ATP synthase F1 subunit gamma [Bacteroidales bacterium]|nr:ATP synthase F1 subunit gamma [Bacteroidales bacterium]